MIRVATADGATRELAPDAALTLAQRLFLAGFFANAPLCAGLGKCGLCRVRFVAAAPPPLPEDLRRLGREAVAAGWRLSCLRNSLLRPCQSTASKAGSRCCRASRLARSLSPPTARA